MNKVKKPYILHLPCSALDLVKIRSGRKRIVQFFILAIYVYFQELRITNSFYSEHSLYSTAIVYIR